ncbi:MAG: exodeoxyribonuclease VII large subunit [Gemmatimonadaceae bacterium]
MTRAWDPDEDPVASIAELTGAAKEIIEGAFPMMWVRGEVTDFKPHRSGHWYFALRDSTAQVRAVVWSRDRFRIPAAPDEGMQVMAYGRLTVYPARGEMQFTVTRIEAEGDGLWRKKLEATRKKLDADGLLAPERKRKLPLFPRTVAVVTSPDGAALQDIIAVVQRRKAKVRLIVVPAKVQGEGAVKEIRRAIVRACQWGQADVIILARGGGSREDLWTFNDEKLARTVAASPVPIISAVGHETDMSLCDLTADVRAPTPSAAAEMVARSEEELVQLLSDLRTRMARTVAWRVDSARNRHRAAGRSLQHAAAGFTQRAKHRVAGLAGRLETLSPLSTLHRGYAVPRDLDGRTLREIAEFAPGMAFELLLRDGAVRATTQSVRENGQDGDR